MNRLCITILTLLLSTGSLAETPPPLCVQSLADMPENWRPTDEVMEGLSDAPWSDQEAKDSRYAIKTGLREMTDLFARHPEAVPELWEDAVGAMIEVTYSSANKPAIDTAARDTARRNLSMLVEPYLQRTEESAQCSDFEDLLPLAIYAHKFYPSGSTRTAKVTALTNSAYRDCGSLETAIGFDYEEKLTDDDISTEELFDLVIWSLLFIEAELYPDIELPAESRTFSPTLWQYLDDYELEQASTYEDGAWNQDFIDMAYLATHIAYIPTGNHRHPIYVSDSPNLYRFHRENFYPVLEMGELDLVAEFVDSLRQYGCTPENDRQVRDGTRYLLKLFHDLGDSWMAYREPGETDADVGNYDFVHKAWTGVLGVRARVLEPSAPGTYGGVVRRWLPKER